MALFTVTRTKTALNTAADHLTIAASATKPLRIYLVDIKGMGTSAVDNEIVMSRSSSGTGPGGTITPAKVHSGSAAASFGAYTSWSVQPTLGDVLWRFGVNANGGIDKLVTIPGAEIPVPAGGQVSLRSISGTSPVTVNLLVEEIDG